MDAIGYSDAARKKAALARKIKSRLGKSAYEAFKRTGVVPPGLDKAKPGAGRSKPSRAARKAAATPRLPKKEMPEIPAGVVDRLPPLSDPDFMRSLQSRPRKTSKLELLALANAQAHQALPDAKVIKHYKDTGVYKRRGLGPKDVKRLRDDWYEGRSVPLWAVPVGTDVAVYRDDKSEVPMIVGKVVGFQERRPLEESGQPMKVSVPYVLVQGQNGKFYEYPALLGGGPRSPHARHPSFAAIDPILRHLNYVPQTGWEFPNFYKGPDAGETGAPDDLERLATSITRASNYARRRAEGKVHDKEPWFEEIPPKEGQVDAMKVFRRGDSTPRGTLVRRKTAPGRRVWRAEKPNGEFQTSASKKRLLEWLLGGERPREDRYGRPLLD